MNAREIVATMYYGLRVAIRSWIALRRGKRFANDGIRVFRKTLNSQGLPPDVVDNLTHTYEANLVVLSITKMSRFVLQPTRESNS
ncbi:MAG: hypothetical protein ACFFBR_04300 [Promethearchaeota archaeon]